MMLNSAATTTTSVGHGASRPSPIKSSIGVGFGPSLIASSSSSSSNSSSSNSTAAQLGGATCHFGSARTSHGGGGGGGATTTGSTTGQSQQYRGHSSRGQCSSSSSSSRSSFKTGAQQVRTMSTSSTSPMSSLETTTGTNSRTTSSAVVISGPITITTVPASSTTSTSARTRPNKSDSNPCDNYAPSSHNSPPSSSINTAAATAHPLHPHSSSTSTTPAPAPATPTTTTIVARSSFSCGSNRQPSPSSVTVPSTATSTPISSHSSSSSSSTTTTNTTNYILLNKLRIQQQKPRRSQQQPQSSGSVSGALWSPLTIGSSRQKQNGGAVSPNSQSSSLVRSSSVAVSSAAQASSAAAILSRCSPMLSSSRSATGSSTSSHSNRIITRVTAQDWLSASGRPQSAGSAGCKKDLLANRKIVCDNGRFGNNNKSRSPSQTSAGSSALGRNPPSLVSVSSSVSSPCNSMQQHHHHGSTCTHVTRAQSASNRLRSGSGNGSSISKNLTSRPSQSQATVKPTSSKSVTSVGTNTQSEANANAQSTTTTTINRSFDLVRSTTETRTEALTSQQQSKPTGAKSITITGVRLNRNHNSNSNSSNSKVASDGSTVYTVNTTNSQSSGPSQTQTTEISSQTQSNNVVSLASRLKQTKNAENSEKKLFKINVQSSDSRPEYSIDEENIRIESSQQMALPPLVDIDQQKPQSELESDNNNHNLIKSDNKPLMVENWLNGHSDAGAATNDNLTNHNQQQVDSRKMLQDDNMMKVKKINLNSPIVSAPTAFIGDPASLRSQRSESSGHDTITDQPPAAAAAAAAVKLGSNMTEAQLTSSSVPNNNNDNCSGFSLATTALICDNNNGTQGRRTVRSDKLNRKSKSSICDSASTASTGDNQLLSFIEQSSPELIFLLNENAKLAYHLSLFENKLNNLEKIFLTFQGPGEELNPNGPDLDYLELGATDNNNISSSYCSGGDASGSSISWPKIIARTRKWLVDVRRKNVFLANFDIANAVKQSKSSKKTSTKSTSSNKKSTAARSKSHNLTQCSRQDSQQQQQQQQQSVDQNSVTSNATISTGPSGPSGSTTFALSSEDELIILLDRIAQFSSSIASKRQTSSMLDISSSSSNRSLMKSPTTTTTAPSVNANQSTTTANGGSKFDFDSSSRSSMSPQALNLNSILLNEKSESSELTQQSQSGQEQSYRNEELRSRWLDSLPANTKQFLGDLLLKQSAGVDEDSRKNELRPKSPINLSTFERIYALKPEILNALIEIVKTGARLIQLGREFDHLTCVYFKSIGGNDEQQQQMELWSQQQNWSSMLANSTNLSSKLGAKSRDQAPAVMVNSHKLGHDPIMETSSATTTKNHLLLGSCGCGCGATNFVSDGDSGGEFTTTTETNEFNPIGNHHHNHHHHTHHRTVPNRNRQKGSNEDTGTDELSSLLNQIALCSQKIIEQSCSGSSSSGSSSASSNHGMTPGAGAGVSSNSTASSGCCCSSTILLDAKYGSVPCTVTGLSPASSATTTTAHLHHHHQQHAQSGPTGLTGQACGQSHSIGGVGGGGPEWPLFDEYQPMSQFPTHHQMTPLAKHRQASIPGPGCGCLDCQQQQQQQQQQLLRNSGINLKSQATYPNLHQLSELNSLSSNKAFSPSVYLQNQAQYHQPQFQGQLRQQQSNRWPGSYHKSSSLTFEDDLHPSSSCDNSGPNLASTATTNSSSSNNSNTASNIFNEQTQFLYGRNGIANRSGKFHHPNGHHNANSQSQRLYNPHAGLGIPNTDWPIHDDPLLMADCLTGGSSAANFMLSSSAIDILSSPSSGRHRQSHSQQRHLQQIGSPGHYHHNSQNMIGVQTALPQTYGSRVPGAPPSAASDCAFIFDPNVDVENFLYEIEKELDDNCYASAPPFLSRQQPQPPQLQQFSEHRHSQSGSSHHHPRYLVTPKQAEHAGSHHSGSFAHSSSGQHHLYSTPSSLHHQSQHQPHLYHHASQHGHSSQATPITTPFIMSSPLVNVAQSSAVPGLCLSSSSTSSSSNVTRPHGPTTGSVCCSLNSGHSRSSHYQVHHSNGNGPSQQLPSLLAGGNWKLSQRNLTEQMSPAAGSAALQLQHSPGGSSNGAGGGHFPFPATTSMPVATGLHGLSNPLTIQSQSPYLQQGPHHSGQHNHQLHHQTQPNHHSKPNNHHHHQQQQPNSPNQGYRRLIVPSASRDLLDKFRTQVSNRVNAETDHQLREIDQWLHNHLQQQQQQQHHHQNNNQQQTGSKDNFESSRAQDDDEDIDDDDEIIVVVEGLPNQSESTAQRHYRPDPIMN